MNASLTALPDPVWRPLWTAFVDAAAELKNTKDEAFRITSEPGIAAHGEENVLTVTGGSNDLRVRTSDDEYSHSSPEAVAGHLLLILRSRFGISDPSRVNTALPRRIRTCRTPFVTNRHLKPDGPYGFDHAALHRSVERSLIGWLGYAPHYDDTGLFGFEIDGRTVYVRVYQDAPVIKIWDCIVDGVSNEDVALLRLVNDANCLQPFIKFMLRDEAIMAWTLVDGWTFSSTNFVTLLNYFRATMSETWDEFIAAADSNRAGRRPSLRLMEGAPRPVIALELPTRSGDISLVDDWIDSVRYAPDPDQDD